MMKTKKNASISILFIGNSFCYYHSLPKLIALFAHASGSGDLFVDGVFRGGATLKMLWDHGEALKMLQNRNWDYVVIQERGRLGGIIKEGIAHVGKPKMFVAYATRFDGAAKKSGAKTVLYCPPSFIGIGFLEDAKKLNAIYTTLAKKLHAEVISSGSAFMLAMNERPHMSLFERDGHHPNPVGTYLFASLFYRKLIRKKISNLPLESFLSRSQRILRNPKTIKLSNADARFLWSIANRTK
jgi:hypothetical protein